MINPRPHNSTRRRGTSLIESLMASVLLATSVVGISGAIATSYQNQTQIQARRDASLAGRKVMESMTALPMDPATAGQPSLSDYQQASTTTTVTATTSTGGLLGGILASLNINVLGIGVVTATTTTTSTQTPAAAAAAAAPAVSVDRRATLNGAASTTGDFATVIVTVPTSGKQPPLKLRRLVTSAEASSNQAP